ncbi:hypothetical protein D3C78_1643740 [compost metagenome]
MHVGYPPRLALPAGEHSRTCPITLMRTQACLPPDDCRRASPALERVPRTGLKVVALLAKVALSRAMPLNSLWLTVLMLQELAVLQLQAPPALMP